MKTPEYCPGCKTKLDPEALNCPNCPMSWSGEDDEDGTVNPLKGNPYLTYAYAAAFLFGMGWLVWALGGALLDLGDEKAGKILAGAQVSTQTVEGMVHSADGAVASPTLEGVSGAEPVKREEPPAEPVVEIETSPEVAVARKHVREWKLRGTVYDLVTLKPIPGCEVRFVDNETNTQAKTMTTSAGLYRTILPPLPDRGYLVEISKPGYSPSYLDPGVEGVREKDETERRGLARDLANTVSGSPATVQAFDETPQVTDFYLAPKR